jgi:hypothetical protein
VAQWYSTCLACIRPSTRIERNKQIICVRASGILVKVTGEGCSAQQGGQSRKTSQRRRKLKLGGKSTCKDLEMG